MKRILLIEDAADTQLIVLKALEGDHEVVAVSTIAAAKAQLQESEFGLILLDAGLPDGDGFKFCASLKSHPGTRTIPILMLTGKAEIEDKLLGFAVGAVDYIVKPFNPLELHARVEAHMRKLIEGQEEHETFRKGSIKLEPAFQRVVIEQDGKSEKLQLTPLEFKMLYHLAKHEDQIFTREQLIDRVWGRGVHIFDRTIDTHISHLRKKLGSFEYVIEPVHGQGYRFTRKSEVPISKKSTGSQSA
ncbi:MAG: response regulator transcription factor [Bdellovibrionota bacterium]